MLLLYNLSIRFYYAAVWMAARWNGKAKAWIDGRKETFSRLQKTIQPTDKVIWFHCSSAGEFEQGKPVMEALKQHYFGYKLLVSFFSPSGYNTAANYAVADVICYLPLDTAANAARFLQLAHPTLAVFVKYEFWHHHLHALAEQQVPTLLVSAVFRKEQVFFQWYGGFFRAMLQCFMQIFVQEEFSKTHLAEIGVDRVNIAGDTRFDRVLQIIEQPKPLPVIEQFVGNSLCIVAGSTWNGDERFLASIWKDSAATSLKFIIAPHQIHSSHINKLIEQFPDAVLYSRIAKSNAAVGSRVLIIDNVGMLSRLYQYATITYVGGGFTKDGIHNILEAAVWSKPVIFGPNHRKYGEASGLIASQGGFSISSYRQLKKLVEDLLSNAGHRQATGVKAGAFVKHNGGATRKIMRYVHENRLLTRL